MRVYRAQHLSVGRIPLRPRAAAAHPKSNLRIERDIFGVKRIAYEEEGWRTWTWRGIDVNYIAMGDSGPPLLLIHGFGASAYQWRYNIPQLAEKHRVYALDLIGFGKSDKLVMDYSGGRIWSDQIADFIRTFIGEEAVYIAGNSIGGYAALATAARTPELVKGIVGLNIAGKFKDDIENMATASLEEGPFTKLRRELGELIRRILIVFAFYLTRIRIRKILLTVYHNKDNVDDDLVRSIAAPAEDPKAVNVYYKLIQGASSKSDTIESLLNVIDVPLLLLWGMKDPWIRPEMGQRILQNYERAELVPLEAGHCLQDECPVDVNSNLISWIERFEA